MVQTRPWTGVCKALMPDVMAPKVDQNNRSYVSSPLDSMQEFSMEGGYMKNPKNKKKTVKIGVWALAQDNTVSCFVSYWSATLLRH